MSERWTDRWGFDIPKNLSVVWGEGSRSFNDMTAKKVGADGFEKGQIEYSASYFPEGQMASMARAISFLAAYWLAETNPKMRYHWATFDLEGVVPENNNNAPIRYDSEGKPYKRAKDITVYQHKWQEMNLSNQ